MTTSALPASNSFLHDLFVPVHESKSHDVKDGIDYVAHYVDTTEGSWDFFRVVDQFLAIIQNVPSLSERANATLGKVRSIASTAGVGLSIPQIISNANSLRHSVSKLFSCQDLPYNDPLRTRKIAQAFKKAFIDSVNLTFIVSQATLFLDNVKLIALKTRELFVVNGIFNLTSLISDGAEGIAECFKLGDYYSPQTQPRTDADRAKLEEKKTLSWLIIAKDAVSVAAAAIALVGVVFGFAIEGVLVLSATLLVLNTVWLTMKLASYFYNKAVVEAPPPRPLII